MNFAEVAGGICVVRYDFGASGEWFPFLCTVQTMSHLPCNPILSRTWRVL